MTQTNNIRVLVVDDTVLFRKVISDILNEVPGVEVVGTANNGRIAISKISHLNPDLLILDIEMPEASGLDVLRHIKAESLTVQAIMFSARTQSSRSQTVEALELGAFDFIPKPECSSIDQAREKIRNDLQMAVKSFRRQVDVSRILRSTKTDSAEDKKKTTVPGKLPDRDGKKSKIIAVGISTGGPNALTDMLPALPADIGIPLVIVQHMPEVFTKSLAESLDTKCPLKITEAVNGQTLENGTIYIAPGGRQMKIISSGEDRIKKIRITNDPPENSCRPSADYLFRSVAELYGPEATGVIMTGMGNDGKEGARLIRDRGGVIIAQDEASCVVYGMSREVIDAGLADIVSPLNAVAEEILKTTRRNS